MQGTMSTNPSGNTFGISENLLNWIKKDDTGNTVVTIETKHRLGDLSYMIAMYFFGPG